MTKSTEFFAVKSNCWFCFYWSHPWRKCPIGKRKYKTRDIKSVLCRCNCLCQHGWKGELKVLLFPYLFFVWFFLFALRDFHSGELSSQHPKTKPCGGTFLRRQGFLAVRPLTFSKMGRRNEKMCSWKKKHFLQVGFIALTQSERELSLTEAGLALTGPLGTDKNVFKQYTEHKQKEITSHFFFCSLASKGEMEICKDCAV